MDKWAKEENLKERINPAVWQVIKRPGRDGKTHVWALPYATYVMTLNIAKTCSGKPVWTPNRPPKNWDELYDYAQKLTIPEKGQYGLRSRRVGRRRGGISLISCGRRAATRCARAPTASGGPASTTRPRWRR